MSGINRKSPCVIRTHVDRSQVLAFDQDRRSRKRTGRQLAALNFKRQNVPVSLKACQFIHIYCSVSNLNLSRERSFVWPHARARRRLSKRPAKVREHSERDEVDAERGLKARDRARPAHGRWHRDSLPVLALSAHSQEWLCHRAAIRTAGRSR
jgi:hypothetical protein